MVFRPGQQKIGGRKKGTVNRATDEVRKLAQKHGAAAIERLAFLMTNAEDERAQVAAAKEIADRAYGRTSSVLGVDPENNRLEVHLIGDDAKL